MIKKFKKKVKTSNYSRMFNEEQDFYLKRNL